MKNLKSDKALFQAIFRAFLKSQIHAKTAFDHSFDHLQKEKLNTTGCGSVW
jgi:hypothetical protein